ncbi:putative T7SS-secreted protein [Actinophytocola sp.]|uniref:putative T7SS-secreted protein n=1 Tax=Actinophytocola sp. TaxID=1872138 RepID=UPI002ED9B383
MTYRGLEFDPTPGRLDAVHAAIAQLTSADSALGTVEPALRDAERQSAAWQGEAAETFRARLHATPADFDATQRRLRDAVAVLEGWARTLTADKRRTEELDAKAVRLRRQLDDARDAVQDRQNALDLAATPSAAAGASIELSGATSRVADLESALAAVLDEARDLEREHRRAADAVADEVAALSGDAPAPRAAESPGIRALAAVLGSASRTSAALGGLLRPPRAGPAEVPGGAGSAFAGALSGGLRPSGELIVLGETPLQGES